MSAVSRVGLEALTLRPEHVLDRSLPGVGGQSCEGGSR